MDEATFTTADLYFVGACVMQGVKPRATRWEGKRLLAVFAAEEVRPIAEQYYGGRLVVKAAEFAAAVRNVYTKMQREEPF